MLVSKVSMLKYQKGPAKQHLEEKVWMTNQPVTCWIHIWGTCKEHNNFTPGTNDGHISKIKFKIAII